MIRMMYKQVAKRSVEVPLVVARAEKIVERGTNKLQQSFPGQGRFSVPHFARFGLRDLGSGFDFGCLAAWFWLRFDCGFCYGPG